MNILVLCHAIVGSKMASPGMRSFNHARVLAQELPDANVTLALPPKLPSDFDPASVDFNVVWPTGGELRRLVSAADIIVTAKFPLKLLPYARNARIVLDLYTPFYTEWMEMSKNDPSAVHRRAWTESKRKNLMAQLAAADLVLCANYRQRDLIVGIMGTLGLVTPRAYDKDDTLGRLIKICPLGIRAATPVRRAPQLKGVWPGIHEGDTVLLWNGTIVEWYDIPLLIRAVHQLSLKRPDIKLFFMGTEHPDSIGAKLLEGLGGGATKEAIRLSKELGILDTHVFFNFGWANEAETEQYLLESDAAVCVYFENLETRYSFRVRYLDVFWASLPMICTKGDVVAEMLDDRELGITVPEGDLGALVAAIERIADDTEFRARCKRNLDEVREEFRWERTLQPLVEFCRHPETALTERRERWMHIATNTADWLVAQGYYNARWSVRGRIRRFFKERQARRDAAR